VKNSVQNDRVKRRTKFTSHSPTENVNCLVDIRYVARALCPKSATNLRNERERDTSATDGAEGFKECNAYHDEMSPQPQFTNAF
jgi:hypothetical protein